MNTLSTIQAIVLISLIAAESIASYVYDMDLYDKKDFSISLILGVISAIIILSTKTFFLGVLIFIHQYSIFKIGQNWYYWVMLLFICDISYYLIHLMSHKVRFFWASHMLHHSSQKFNFATVMRGPVFYLSFRMIFWIPMVLIGFPPAMVIITDSMIQLYTVFTHTTTIGRLGFFEKFMNTPAHHRLHHASNPEYIDKNFGGLFIIWDRIFKTFINEKDKPVFGLPETKNINSPVKLILLEWKLMIGDLKEATSFYSGFKTIFGNPGSFQIKKQIATKKRLEKWNSIV